jgi:hypothetical protein
MTTIGLALIAMGVAILAGFGAFEGIRALIESDDIHIAARIGIATFAAGFTAVFVAVVRDRFREHGQERLENIEP